MTRPVRSRTRSLVAGGAQLLAAAGGAPVLPDQGPVQRLAADRVPGDGGLALVGDPDRVQLGPLDPGIGDRLPGDPPGHRPRFRAGRARPSRAAESAARTPSSPGRPPAPRRRRRGRSCRSSPGLWRGSSTGSGRSGAPNNRLHRGRVQLASLVRTNHRPRDPHPLREVGSNARHRRSSPALQADLGKWSPRPSPGTSAAGSRARWSTRSPATATQTPRCVSWSASPGSRRAPSTSISTPSRTAFFATYDDIVDDIVRSIDAAFAERRMTCAADTDRRARRADGDRRRGTARRLPGDRRVADPRRGRGRAAATAPRCASSASSREGFEQRRRPRERSPS